MITYGGEGLEARPMHGLLLVALPTDAKKIFSINY